MSLICVLRLFLQFTQRIQDRTLFGSYSIGLEEKVSICEVHNNNKMASITKSV